MKRSPPSSNQTNRRNASESDNDTNSDLSLDDDSDSNLGGIESGQESVVSSTDSDDNSNSDVQHHRVRVRWTEDEVTTLKTMKRRGISNDVIAQRLQRTSGSVQMKWSRIENER